MARFYLALGSNLGNRLQNLNDAVLRLAERVTVTRVSAVYDTEPWGIAAQPRFLNLVLQGETTLTPLALLTFLKHIEHVMGRQATVRFGPRVIDLDILLYDDVVLRSDVLEIPHPRMAERRFVLMPLVEIAPDVQHPILKQSAAELLARLPDTGDVHWFAAWE